MINRKLLALWICLSTGILASVAQTADVSNLTLDECVAYALENKQSVINAKLDEQISFYRTKEIRGIGLPQVSAGGTLNDYIELPTSLLPAEFFGGSPGTFIPVKFGVKYTVTGAVDVSQIIFDGSYIVALQASSTYQDLAKKNTIRTKVEVIHNVKKAYYGVMVNAERLKLLDISLLRLEAMLNDTRAMYNQGFVERIDLDRLQVSYNNLLTERQKVAQLSQLGVALLKFQMGMPMENALLIKDSLKTIDPTTLTTLPTDTGAGYTARPEYSLLQTQFNLYGLDVKNNRFQRLPNLVAFGSFQKQAQRNEFNFFESGQPWFNIGLIGLKMNVPIFDGFQKYYRIQQAQVNMEKTQTDMLMLRDAIAMEKQTALINLQNAISSLKIQEDNLKLATDVANVAKIKYDQGVGSNLEVVTAESSLKESQTNYYTALYDVLVYRTDFEKACGTLIPDNE